MPVPGGRSASWSANMSSNKRNVKFPFFTTRCHYQGGRSATWSANMSSNNRNVKLPFFTTRCHYQGVDPPVDLPIWALTGEMWYCQSWPLNTATGGVDLLVDLPICALTVEMWNCHSSPLDATVWGRSESWSVNMSSNSKNVKLTFFTTRCHYQGVDPPVDLPIWALTVEMWNCHSWPLDSLMGGRSASWSANMSFNSRNVKLPFLTTWCHY